METGRFMQRVRKWSRSLHRDLSYFFTGVLVVYAVSGFMLNHKKDFNSDYSIVREERKLATPLPQGRDAWNRERVAEAIAPYGGADAYLKHYFPEEGTLKVFIRGGSTFTLDLTTGNGLFESVRKRTVLSAFNRLHYNPSRWWTIFSDIFLAGLLVIVATGLVMSPPPHTAAAPGHNRGGGPFGPRPLLFTASAASTPRLQKQQRDE
ncbi:MAG: peptidase [Alistipes sp. 58_9_plus]|nr:MAG: peptidase [Alistipes sp. 58_9_plus]